MWWLKSASEKFVAWQYVLFFLHMVASIMAATLISLDGNDWAVPVELQFNVWTSDDGDCIGENGCTIVKLNKKAFDIYTGSFVPFFSVISGTHHLYVATKGETYLRGVQKKNGVAFARHLDYACSAPLMFCLDSILWLAPPSLQQIVYSLAFMFLIIVLGYSSEVAWASNEQKASKIIYFAALLPFILVWSVSWVIFDAGMHYDTKKAARQLVMYNWFNSTIGLTQSKPPDFVYVILVLIFVTYLLFPVAHAMRIFSTPPKAPESITENDIIVHESRFGYLSFISKIPLLAVYATAVSSRSDRIGIQEIVTNVTNTGPLEDPAFVALGVTGSLCLVLGLWMYFDLRATL